MVTTLVTMRYKEARIQTIPLSRNRRNKKSVLQNNHAELSKLSLKEIVELASDSFHKVNCVTQER